LIRRARAAFLASLEELRDETPSGSRKPLDRHREVREFVEEVLEGGKAAFELRRLKYGF